MTKSLKIYVAGKVSKDSVFGTHHWRAEFVDTLAKLSGLKLTNLDPTKAEAEADRQLSHDLIFGSDVFLISQADVMVVYLSDDISVGGSQEILIAKYFNKPVIGLAPKGGKFNGSKRQMFGVEIANYKDPFVFATCDDVCDGIEAVAQSLKTIQRLDVQGIDLIAKAWDEYRNTIIDTSPEIVYNKLVRDKVPDNIAADGKISVDRVLTVKEYKGEIIRKLNEEMRELIGHVSIDELADIQELVNALTRALDKTPADLAAAQKRKVAKNGGFGKRIFLERVLNKKLVD
jgi:predicted house-cleaning noncanonical NTP pyrophosphatase (MazG superfamily)